MAPAALKWLPGRANILATPEMLPFGLDKTKQLSQWFLKHDSGKHVEPEANLGETKQVSKQMLTKHTVITIIYSTTKKKVQVFKSALCIYTKVEINDSLTAWHLIQISHLSSVRNSTG